MVHIAALILAALAAPQGKDADLVGRWTFDGDVKDSGPAALPTKAVGRLEFVDSPIGGSGKMAVFNGVDSQIDITLTGDLGTREFTVAAWVFFLDLKPVRILHHLPGWDLILRPDGVLEWQGREALRTGTQAILGRQWTHLAMTHRKTEAGFEMAIWVNGESAATLPQREPLPAPADSGLEIHPFTGMMDDLRFYRRALSRDELCRVVDEGLPWIRPKPHAKTPFPGKFELLRDDVVVFAGGENARVGLDLGYLETVVSLRSAGKSARFRNMAWEGDTVYEQPRPLNFGSWSDQLRRVGATVVFAQFGQLEALEGQAGLERFTRSYEALLEQVARTTKRIVLVSPTPFGKGPPPQPDLSSRNGDLKLYVDAIRGLAAKNGYLFVDLTTRPLTGTDLTRDGLHLTTAGQWIAARETVRQLELAGVSDLDEPNSQGAFPREAYEKIRATIRTKNQLWNDSWRPGNWAFLNGDRTEQPSSRDHLDRRIRWFPVEVQQFPAMIRREEEKIDSLIQASEKK